MDREILSEKKDLLQGLMSNEKLAQILNKSKKMEKNIFGKNIQIRFNESPVGIVLRSRDRFLRVASYYVETKLQ